MVIGINSLAAIYNVSASITICVAKNNCGLDISKLSQNLSSPWRIMLLALSVLVRIIFLILVIHETPTYIIILYTTSDLLYGVMTIFCVFLIEIMTNYIIMETKSCKHNKDINQLTVDYSSLVDALGPHLLSILSVTVLKITLVIFGFAKFITGCEGIQKENSVFYLSMMFVDVQVIVFYCSTLHNCNAAFKNVADNLR